MIKFTLPRGQSYSYVCPYCGELWAKGSAATPDWCPVRSPCADCPPWGLVMPGSLANIFLSDGGYYRDLPRSMLEREFGLFEKEAERLASATLSCHNSSILTLHHMESNMPQLMQDIASYRAKVLDGTISDAELREALLVLRADRMSAATASKNSRAAKAAVPAPHLTPDAVLGLFD